MRERASKGDSMGRLWENWEGFGWSWEGLDLNRAGPPEDLGASWDGFRASWEAQGGRGRGKRN